MQDEKETKEKLLRSARAEFLEKGYASASLRTICRNAGVTTGALYFFFKDKEDLFASLVEGPLHTVLDLMREHFEAEAETFRENPGSPAPFLPSDRRNDVNISRGILHLLYSHGEEMMLILTKAQGSRFERILDTFVGMTETHYRALAELIRRQTHGPAVDDRIIHWVAHNQVDAFVYLLTHVPDETQAMELVPQMVSYLESAWYAVFGVRPPATSE